MNRHLGSAAFGAGLAVVLWVGAGYVGTSLLALAMTVLIAAVYAAGALELRRFQHATAGLDAALAALAALSAPPPRLSDWLARLHPTLHNAVRLRIEGERVGLPGPAMAPYLVGLLVLLGMLGTFLGMVVTLKGAVLALESTTDLPTIRAALAAPVQGLGLAFGTSVAGVAASAMLGLMSALCRRERGLAALRLDTHIATTLRAHSLAHQREQQLQAQQAQARLLPALVERLDAMALQMDQRGTALHEQLRAGQDHFHKQAQSAYSGLAAAVERSLQDSLVGSARAAGAALQPAVEAAMSGLARESTAFHQRMSEAVVQQLDGLAARFASTLEATSARSGSLQAAQQAEAAARDEQRLAAWTQSLAALAASLHQAWQQAGADLQAQQAQVCHTLEHTAADIHAQAEAHARATVGEVSRLIETASEAPRAAAELVGQLREKLSDSLVRDNAMLDERRQLLGTLATLLDAVNGAAHEQRAAVDALVAASAGVLQQAGTQFGAQLDTGTARLAEAATQITGSAVEVASLGEAFGHGVQLFSESSAALGTQLQRIEAALGKSTARSDEQLAYYVAQARELIDLSISSQKQIVDDLQQIARRPAPLSAEPA